MPRKPHTGPAASRHRNSPPLFQSTNPQRTTGGSCQPGLRQRADEQGICSRPGRKRRKRHPLFARALSRNEPQISNNPDQHRSYAPPLRALFRSSPGAVCCWAGTADSRALRGQTRAGLVEAVRARPALLVACRQSGLLSGRVRARRLGGCPGRLPGLAGQDDSVD